LKESNVLYNVIERVKRFIQCNGRVKRSVHVIEIVKRFIQCNWKSQTFCTM